MLQHVIDALGIVVGLLGLAALWIDPREERNKRKFLVVSIVTIVLVEAGFLIYDSYKEREAARQDEIRLTNKEHQIASLLCAGDMNYEQIYETASFGWSDSDLNNAIDDMMQNKRWLTAPVKRIVLPQDSQREIPVRFYHLEDRKMCDSK